MSGSLPALIISDLPLPPPRSGGGSSLWFYSMDSVRRARHTARLSRLAIKLTETPDSVRTGVLGVKGVGEGVDDERGEGGVAQAEDHGAGRGDARGMHSGP